MKASQAHNFIIIIFALSAVLVNAVPNPAQAQSADDNEDMNIDDSTIGIYERPVTSRPLYANQENDTAVTRLDPTEALMRSLFLPGWGQLSNRKYIKAGIIMTAEILLIINLAHYIEKTEDARQAFELATNDTEKSILFNKYQDAEDDRSRFGWYLGTLVLISMFDAFVDAHLADFPQKNESLTLSVNPKDKTGLSVNLAFNF